MITDFGKLVRKYRIDRDMRLLDMAKEFGVSSAYLSSIENGKRPIPKDLVTRIAGLLNLNDQQIEQLKEAELRSQSEIKIFLKDKSEQQRKMISMFARTVEKSDLDERDARTIMGILEGACVPTGNDCDLFTREA